MKRSALLLFAALAVLSETKDKKAKIGPTGGIATPGIQIPFASLKPEATVALAAPASSLLFSRDLLAAAPAQILRIATKENKILDPWAAEESLCGGMVSAFGHVWAPACGKNLILKLDPKTGKAVNRLEIGAQAGGRTIAATGDSIWAITDAKGTLSRIDPETNSVVAEIKVAPDCVDLVYEAEALWAACPAQNRVLRIDAKTNVVSHRIEAATEPVALAFANASLYVLGRKDGKISQIDPKTNKATTAIETKVTGVGGSLAAGEGFLWLSQPGFPLTKIDDKNSKVVQQFWGEGAGAIQFAAGSIWLAPAGKPQLLRIDPKRVALTLAE
jgi:streptogramin lyase